MERSHRQPAGEEGREQQDAVDPPGSSRPAKADAPQTRLLKNAWDSGKEGTKACSDGAAVARSLLLWLQQLPEALLPECTWPLLLAACSSSSATAQLQALRKALCQVTTLALVLELGACCSDTCLHCRGAGSCIGGLARCSAERRVQLLMLLVQAGQCELQVLALLLDFLDQHCSAAAVATQQVASVFGPLLCSMPSSPRSPGPVCPSSPDQESATAAVALLISHAHTLFSQGAPALTCTEASQECSADTARPVCRGACRTARGSRSAGCAQQTAAPLATLRAARQPSASLSPTPVQHSRRNDAAR